MERKQGFCLLAEEGWLHMEVYDQLPSQVRQRLRASPFNLCPSCVAGGCYQDMLENIHDMEDMMREREEK